MIENNSINKSTSSVMSKHSGRSIKKLYSQSVRALRTSNHGDALLLTQEIIARQSDHAGAHAVQFSCLFKSKQLELARLIGNQAAKLNPKSVFILNNQACLELEAKNPAPAANLLSSLIEQYGERAQWLYNLGLAYELTGQLEKAVSIFRRTLDQDPKHHKAARQLTQTLQKLGHYEEASQALNYCRLLRNDSDTSHSDYIHCSAISNNISASGLRHELNLWGNKFIPKGNRYDVVDLTEKKQLTIGFISPTLTPTWLERSVIPVATQLANNGDRILIYGHGQAIEFSDSIEFIDARNLSDADFARRVRADQVDALIDLCGMRTGNRQRSLGLQLASKQFSWLGHEGAFATPLLSSLENQLTDDDNEQTSFCITPISNQSNSSWPSNTFAGLSAEQGLSYDVIKTWAAILLQCPDWHLQLQTNNNQAIETVLAQRFSAAGVKRDRVKFSNNVQYTHDTIVLDNFIHNNPVHLVDALFNNATVLTLSGPLFPAQQSALLVKQLGLDDYVCDTQASFIQRAVELANGKQAMAVFTEFQAYKDKLSDTNTFASRLRKIIMR